MPVASFSGAPQLGVRRRVLSAPHHAYGGPDGFKRFVDACHQRGLVVILDVVYNHLGPEGNYLGLRALLHRLLLHPVGSGGQLRPANSDEVRRFVCDNALGWLRDYHVDGLRLDAVHAIIDTSATHLLEQMATRWRLEAEVGRPLFLIAESDLNDPRLCRPRARPAASGSTPSGATTSTTPCTSPSPARPTATTRTSGRSVASPAPWSGSSSTPAALQRVPGPHPRSSARTGLPPPNLPRLPAEPRPGGQPGHRRPVVAQTVGAGPAQRSAPRWSSPRRSCR
jgi:hypothetical protein